MGDMADWAIENALLNENAGDSQYTDEPRHTLGPPRCRYCGRGDLQWFEHWFTRRGIRQSQWRLYEDDKLHRCIQGARASMGLNARKSPNLKFWGYKVSYGQKKTRSEDT